MSRPDDKKPASTSQVPPPPGSPAPEPFRSRFRRSVQPLGTKPQEDMPPGSAGVEHAPATLEERITALEGRLGAHAKGRRILLAACEGALQEVSALKARVSRLEDALLRRADAPLSPRPAQEGQEPRGDR